MFTIIHTHTLSLSLSLSLASQAAKGNITKFQKVIQSLKNNNLSAIIIHHSTKGGESPKGPVELEALMQNIFRLGSGLVIFKGRKTGYAGGTSEVSPCVPCFIFPKVRWSVSNRSFPVLTVFPVWMTGVSSAASSTSSSTDFSGKMHLMSTAPTKRCTTALSGGAGSVFSIKFSLS